MAKRKRSDRRGSGDDDGTGPAPGRVKSTRRAERLAKVQAQRRKKQQRLMTIVLVIIAVAVAAVAAYVILHEEETNPIVVIETEMGDIEIELFMEPKK